ncbi:MAG: hypothetical protein ABFD64_13580 [Armatimonadota bacterium]
MENQHKKSGVPFPLKPPVVYVLPTFFIAGIIKIQFFMPKFHLGVLEILLGILTGLILSLLYRRPLLNRLAELAETPGRQSWIRYLTSGKDKSPIRNIIFGFGLLASLILMGLLHNHLSKLGWPWLSKAGDDPQNIIFAYLILIMSVYTAMTAAAIVKWYKNLPE